ncbi:MAG TPA: PocR ligand-binding domain-containing protein [Geobacteraceae bacterium]|nr:PocR ligand-binding domain-containing protein [Geobacteraceae bacterium]
MKPLNFAQLVDIEQIQRLLDAHYKVTGAISAILDTNENVLAATGWHDICVRFHRAHPVTCARCRESDAFIKASLPGFTGEYLEYKCKNGLQDVSVPIIINGEHLATFFTGQFFYEDDKPDLEYFRAQAREFGFDEESYLEALVRVPVFNREQIRNIMVYNRNLVQIIGEMGLKNLELSQEAKERKKAEAAQSMINRALKTLSSCTQVLVHAKSEIELMESICRAIVEAGKYRFAWVGFAENDPDKTVSFMTQWGYEGGFQVYQHLSWADNERGQGPTGTAIRTGTTNVVRHIATNPAYKLWRDEALKRGYASCISLPLLNDVRPFGALSIYAEEPDAFDAEEIALLKQLADDLAYGIVAIRAQSENRELERRLRHSQKMETIGTMARGIAHDFNNIMGAIINSVEMALEDAQRGSELRELLEIVQKAGYRGREIVRQISEFSRQKELARQPVNVEIIIKECLKLLQAAILPSIEIRQHIPAGLGMIEADSTQIHQVIVNLCTNAAQAMREKGGVLDISLEEAEVDDRSPSLNPGFFAGHYLVLTVKDSGHGMDRNVMDRIFDPFFTTKKNGEGSGLGLSVVYGIVESHGGAITVESEPGKGSTFKVYFPLKENVAASCETEKPMVVPEGNERILLVDDEEDLVHVQQKMLERLGYDVIARKSAAEALEMFNSQPERFDLVVTDLAMPGMSGLDLAREILRIRPDISVILCTAYLNPSDGGITSEEARSAGIRELLKKPTSRSEMARAIRRVLDERKLK